MKRALLLIDLQNDFCPGGALAVPHGDDTITVANRAIAASQTAGVAVLASQDWHPADHLSFAANHSDAVIGECGELAGLPQIWWPVHCVQGQHGADFHPALNTSAFSLIIQKGTQTDIDSYSAFFDNGHRAQTILDGWLRQQEITHLTVMGLATDYCVKATVLDALALKYQVDVLIEGCRGVNLRPEDSQNALNEMERQGARLITLEAYLDTVR